MAESDTVRPSPEALLAEAQRHERGRLKIFLGAAPGVGKTYEMLSVARRKLAEGVDVAVGIVETHGRQETEALLHGLPRIPRRRLTHRERELEELDLDALLEHKPRLALVDELAHTNVPGSRHAKRYQDVQELLDAGIDVYTTLNVQHLESFNDIVGRITGVEVRETVPDAIIEQAHDVELIDLPPDDLIERLRQGKVYVPDAARRALDHYFSRGNLLALRELALRAASERVDDDMSVFMRAHAIAGPWPARGRLIVCVDATAASEHVIRTAKRLADQRHLPWTAIYVQTLGSATSARARLDANLALASQLGADTAILTGDRVGEVIVEYSRTHNAAQIVVGRSMDVRHRFWPRRRLAQWLLDHATDFEITIVAAPINGSGDGRPVQSDRARKWLTSRDVALAIGFSAGAAVIGKLLEPYTDSASLALIFLLAATFAGATGGLVASVLCSVIAFTAYNYLFTEPRYSLSVDNPQDVTTLVVFLAVSFVVGQLAARLRRQAHDAWLSTRRVETLFDFSRRLATAVDDRDLLTAAATGLSELLGKRCVVLRANAQHRADPPVELERAGEFRDTDQAAADWAIGHRETAGRGTGTLPAAAWYFVPIQQSGEVFGVIGVHLPATSDGVDAEQNRLLFTLQTQLAAACERFRLREAAQSAQIQKAAESLRAALLASVSHDLRTPLVSITGALTALRELSHRIPEEDQDRLLGSAIGEAQRLNRLIQNLLDMTRLSHGALALRASAVDVRDAVSQAISQLDGVLAGHQVDVLIPATLPPVHADATLLGQVLANLLENAGKFAPSGTTVRVDAHATADAIYVTVADRGPGIPAAERGRVFDLFYRAGQRDNGTAGAGMGLAISKGFVEAMGGKIGIADSAEGTAVEIQLPRAPAVIPA
ncbi:two-component system sensor histidine kinase KdpD [Povalibacter uvarum]|uniref:histidine kinase n=1 Tax=Povalibacter uvarum TaxID=732238 RepID=A0A841HPR4_9GAMM|nr:sensor histidine kinase KdpD [Povalibacter uvarum]MBB6094108.1 two-component system sensor histidine kinase KdpD [Povalibacter uvarum]